MLPLQRRKQTKTPAEREAEQLIDLLQQFGARWEVGAVSRGSQEPSAHQQAAKALVQLAEALQQHKAAARRGDVRLAATAAVSPQFLVNLLSLNGRASGAGSMPLQLWGALLAALQGLARWIPAVLDQQLAPVLLDTFLEGQAAHMTAHLLVLGLSQWHLYQIWPLWVTRQVTHHLFNQLRHLLGLPLEPLPQAADGLAGGPQQQSQQQPCGSQVWRSQQQRVLGSADNNSSSSNTSALIEALRGTLALLCHVSTCSSAAYGKRLWGPPAVAGGRLAAVLQLAARKELLLADHGLQQLVMQLLNSCLAVESVHQALFDSQRHSCQYYSSSSSSDHYGQGSGTRLMADAGTSSSSLQQQLLKQCQLTSMCHIVLSRPCVLGESLDVNISIWVAAAQALSGCGPLWATAAAAAGGGGTGGAAAAAAGGIGGAAAGGEGEGGVGPGAAAGAPDSSALAKQQQQLSDITAAAAETLQGLEWLHRGCSSLSGELAAAALQLLLAATQPMPHQLGSKPPVTPWVCHLVSRGSYVRLIDHLALLVESSRLQLVAPSAAPPGTVWGMQLADASWLVLLQLCSTHTALGSTTTTTTTTSSSNGCAQGTSHSPQAAVISRPQLQRLLSEYGRVPAVTTASDAASDISSRGSWLGCVRLGLCRGLLSWAARDKTQLQAMGTPGTNPSKGSSSGGHMSMSSVVNDLKHALACCIPSTTANSSSSEGQTWSQSARAAIWLQSASVCIAAADACPAVTAAAAAQSTSSSAERTHSSDWQQVVGLLVAALQLAARLLLVVASASTFSQGQAMPWGSGGHVECLLAALVCLHTLSELLPAAASAAGQATGHVGVRGPLLPDAQDSAWPGQLRPDMEGLSSCLSQQLRGVLQQLVLAGQGPWPAGAAAAFGQGVMSPSVAPAPTAAASAAAAAELQHHLGCLVSCWAASAVRSCFGQVGVSGDVGSCLKSALEGDGPAPDAVVVRPAAAGAVGDGAGASAAAGAAGGGQQTQAMRQHGQGQEQGPDACGEISVPVHAVLVAAGAPVLAERLCYLKTQQVATCCGTMAVASIPDSSSCSSSSSSHGESAPAGARRRAAQQQLRLVLSAAIPGRPLRWLLQLLQVGCCEEPCLSPLQQLLQHHCHCHHQQPHQRWLCGGDSSTGACTTATSSSSSLHQALQVHTQEVQLLRQLAKKMQVAAVAAVCSSKVGVFGCRLPLPHPWLHLALPQQQLVVVEAQGGAQKCLASTPEATQVPAAVVAASNGNGPGDVQQCVPSAAGGDGSPAGSDSRHRVLRWQPVGPLDPLLQQLPSHVNIPVTTAAAVGGQQMSDVFADVCLAAALQTQDVPWGGASGCSHPAHDHNSGGDDDSSTCSRSSSGSSGSGGGSSSCGGIAGAGCQLVLVPAHSVVLFSRCTYFEALLSSRWQQDSVPLPHQGVGGVPVASAGPASNSGDSSGVAAAGDSLGERGLGGGSSEHIPHRRLRLLVVPGADAATLIALQHWLYTGRLEYQLLPSVVTGTWQQQERERVQPGCSSAPPATNNVQQQQQQQQQQQRRRRQSQAGEECVANVQSSQTADERSQEGEAAAASANQPGPSVRPHQQGGELVSQLPATCSSKAPSSDVKPKQLQQATTPDRPHVQPTRERQHMEQQQVFEGCVLAPCALCAPAATFLRLWQVCDLLLLPQLQQQCAAAVTAELQQLQGGCLVALLRLALEVAAAPAAELVLVRLQQLRDTSQDLVTGVAGGEAAPPSWLELQALPSELQQLLQQAWYRDASDVRPSTGGGWCSSGWDAGGAEQPATIAGGHAAAGAWPKKAAVPADRSGPEALLKVLQRLQSLARS